MALIVLPTSRLIYIDFLGLGHSEYFSALMTTMKFKMEKRVQSGLLDIGVKL
jgi:hypothetical protein